MTAPSSPEAPWPVRTVARKIADWIGRLGEVWVEGQVAQLSRRGGAATVFLTLRDPAADLSVPVTCHRDVAERPGLELTEGARVIVRARPDYYVARGSFSLRATRDPGRRPRRTAGPDRADPPAARRRGPLRRRPQAPAAVRARASSASITGRDSAAERDVLVTARRRWPAVRFEMFNCAVQGPQAAANVIDGLRRLDADPDVEVIVIARGGGSVEDLLPFSDEGLVRAIAATRTPVVTAVGHETDTTLVDHVADVRAATPTDAAHRIVPEIGEQRRLVDGLRARARHLLSARLEQQERWLESVRTRPVAGLARPAAARPGGGRPRAAHPRPPHPRPPHRGRRARPRARPRPRGRALPRGDAGARLRRRPAGRRRTRPRPGGGRRRRTAARPGGRRPAARARRPQPINGPDHPGGRPRMSGTENADPRPPTSRRATNSPTSSAGWRPAGSRWRSPSPCGSAARSWPTLCQHWLDRARERLAAAAPEAQAEYRAPAQRRDGLQLLLRRRAAHRDDHPAVARATARSRPCVVVDRVHVRPPTSTVPCSCAPSRTAASGSAPAVVAHDEPGELVRRRHVTDLQGHRVALGGSLPASVRALVGR